MFASGQGVQKLSAQDIIEGRPVPEIKVCSQQKIVYKLAKCQTLRKQCKKRKLKNQWKLQSVNAPKSQSIKMSLWTRDQSDNKQIRSRNLSFLSKHKKEIISYGANGKNANESYHRIGLSSMEWTRYETDLLLTLCNNFGNRWSVIIDRYNACKPSKRPTRNMIEIKQRYYECKNKINNAQFKYDGMREAKRRQELNKLLLRTYDNNMEISHTLQCYRKHNKLLKAKINQIEGKQMQLKKQSHFLTLRQENNRNSRNNNDMSCDMQGYQGYGVCVEDTNNNNNRHRNVLDLAPHCIPKKISKIKRYIQMIDDEYTKYKYELKLDGINAVIVPFPYIDHNKFDGKKKKNNHNNSNNHNNGNNNRSLSEEELLVSSNPTLGREIAKLVQQELVKQNIINIEQYTGTPKIHPMTNTTRAMLNVLREDYIKYYAMKTMINDLKKKQQK